MKRNKFWIVFISLFTRTSKERQMSPAALVVAEWFGSLD